MTTAPASTAAASNEPQNPDRSQRILILGGGFGGLYTALRLSEFPWVDGSKPEIVLIDRDDRFVFLPLLYELMTGELQSWEVAPPFAEVLSETGVRFLQAGVTHVDFEKRSVALDTEQNLNYDSLVLGLGGETPLDGVPGAAEQAFPFRTIGDAYRLEDRLRYLEDSDRDKIRLVVVGGGYSGVELACKLADRLGERGRIRIVEQGDRILSNSPDFNREAADRALQERGIWLNLETRVKSISEDSIALDYRGQVDDIPLDTILWTVGNRVPQLVRDFPIEKDDRGRIVVSETLQVRDRPEVFALGDLAACRDADGQQVAPTAQAALQQSDYAAWNIWAAASDRPLLPFRYNHLGEMLALGSTSATFTGLGLKLDGPLAYAARRLVYLYRLPSLQHQVKVGLNWFAKPFLDAIGLSV